MRSIESLVDALALCIPRLDRLPLLKDLLKSDDRDGALLWIIHHLKAQQLLVLVRRPEFCGEVPPLKLLNGIDLPLYDSSFILMWVEDVNWDGVSSEVAASLLCDLPYLEYLNGFLRPYRLRLVDLSSALETYVIAVRDDEQTLEVLEECLGTFGLKLNFRRALDGQQTLVHLSHLLSSSRQ